MKAANAVAALAAGLIAAPAPAQMDHSQHQHMPGMQMKGDMKPMAGDAAAAAAMKAADDTREKVDMPPEVVDVLRFEMRTMLATFTEVTALMAQGKRAQAAKAAEDGLGMAHMGKHRGNVHPGMYMPDGMRGLAMGMHKAGDDLARQLKTKNSSKDWAALQGFLGSCASCHSAYRVR